MSNSRLYSEWGAFAGIPYQFIDNASGCSDQARWLFVLLMRHANHETGEAFPSYQLLSAKTGWTNKTISKAVKELEEKGWITRKKQFSGPTVYTLVRPQLFPTGTGSSCSLREQMQFPQGTTVVPVGTSNKTNINKINNNNTQKKEVAKAPSQNLYFDLFAQKYEERFGYPYASQKADFVQFAKWQKLDEGRTSVEDFGRAISNYLGSPSGRHTFADLVTRFAVFRLSALDRFGKPVERSTPTPGSAPPRPRYCSNCVSGWIMPKSSSDRAVRCSCQEVSNGIAV